MNTRTLITSIACSAAAIFGAQSINAQQVVEEQVAVVSETVGTTVPCKTHYYANAGDNWFIQLGAGVNSPFVENYLPAGDSHHQLTAVYNFGFGKWMSPYLGWRLSFLGGAIHWNNQTFSKAKYVNANFDLMWDMFNSLGGVNQSRVFSIVPFVGLGGTFGWDYKASASNAIDGDGRVKSNQWTLPVSAGLQLRFRLCRYVDFFAEGRAQFYGDNFNNCTYGQPVDVNLSVIGGFSFNIGGSDFKTYNPCDYLGYINSLNGQVNDLRASLAETSAALAAAEAQLPCPEVTETATTVVEAAPLMATVRFTINSAVITPEEEVNVYNIAQWMKANPDQNVAVIGYADKDTGTAAYNMGLSQRRAQAVVDALTNKYGINPDRLAVQAEGSSVQPYEVNNWNRIVVFTVAQ